MRPERHARLPGFASLIGLLALALLPPAAAPAGTGGPEAATATAGTATAAPLPPARHLTGTVDLVGPKTTIQKALNEIARQRPDLHLAVDPDLTKDGPLDTVIGDLNLRRIPVEEALRLTLAAKTALVFRVEPERVLVTSHEKALADLVTVSYPIGDILPKLMAEPGSQTDSMTGHGGGLGGLFTVGPIDNQQMVPVELRTIFKQMVNFSTYQLVAQWSDEGGPATLTIKRETIKVKQTREGQEAIAAVLTKFRAALAAGHTTVREALAEADKTAAAEPEEVLAVRRLLAKRIDVDLERTPMSEAIPTVVAKTPGLQWRLDPEIFREGIDLSSRLITLRGKQATVQSVLDLILSSDLGYEVRPGYLLVTTRAHLNRKLPVVIYNVMGLLLEPVRPKPESVTSTLPDGRPVIDTPFEIPSYHVDDFTETMTILKMTVNSMSDPRVAQWSDEGGPGVLQDLDGRFIIAQTRRGHEQIAELLPKLLAQRKAFVESLSQERTGKPRPFTPPVFKAPEDDVSPEDKAVLAQLEKAVNFQVADKPLVEVIEMIRAAAPDLNIVVSADVAANGVDMDSRKVTLSAKNVPLRTVLDQALVIELGWRIREGWLEITARVCLGTNLPIALYPVFDIVAHDPTSDLPGAMTYDDLIAHIKKTVNNEPDKGVAKWSDEGGPAVIFMHDGALLITQTPHGHQKVRECLNSYILGLTGGAEQKPAP